MRRLIGLTSIAVILTGLTGCHHWHKRRAAAVCCSNCCDPCVAAAPITVPVTSLSGPPVVSKVLPYTSGTPQFP
jgi:hypothetical protein